MHLADHTHVNRYFAKVQLWQSHQLVPTASVWPWLTVPHNRASIFQDHRATHRFVSAWHPRSLFGPSWGLRRDYQEQRSASEDQQNGIARYTWSNSLMCICGRVINHGHLSVRESRIPLYVSTRIALYPPPFERPEERTADS